MRQIMWKLLSGVRLANRHAGESIGKKITPRAANHYVPLHKHGSRKYPKDGQRESEKSDLRRSDFGMMCVLTAAILIVKRRPLFSAPGSPIVGVA
jgi:hypothetical protein